MVDEARQWFVEVSPPSADEEGGEHAIVNPSGTHILHSHIARTYCTHSLGIGSHTTCLQYGVLLIAHKLVISE